MFIFLTIIGIIFAPIFTLGCVLIHFDHEWLGVFAIIISLLKCIDNDN